MAWLCGPTVMRNQVQVGNEEMRLLPWPYVLLCEVNSRTEAFRSVTEEGFAIADALKTVRKGKGHRADRWAHPLNIINNSFPPQLHTEFAQVGANVSPGPGHQEDRRGRPTRMRPTSAWTASGTWRSELRRPNVAAGSPTPRQARADSEQEDTKGRCRGRGGRGRGRGNNPPPKTKDAQPNFGEAFQNQTQETRIVEQDGLRICFRFQQGNCDRDPCNFGHFRAGCNPPGNSDDGCTFQS